MARYEHGRIESATWVTYGSELAVDAASGAFTVTVTETADFHQNRRAVGTLLINGQQARYDPNRVNTDTGTITLLDPLTAAAEAGDRVDVWDPNAGAVAADLEAMVWLDGDDDDNTEPIPILFRTDLQDTISDDVSGLAGDGATLEWDDEEDEYLIVGLPGRAVKRDATFLDPDTITDGIPGTPDGLPPEFSPVPQTLPAIGAIIVKFQAVPNHDPVTYDIYMSTDPTCPVVAANLAGTIQGSLLFVRTVPATGATVAVGTPYYFRAVARDFDGAADPSAVVTGQVAATLDALLGITKTNVTDDMIQSPILQSGIVQTVILNASIITADEAWIDAINAVVVTAETLQTSNDPTTGIKIGPGYGGLKAYNGVGVSTSIDQYTGIITVYGTSGTKLQIADSAFSGIGVPFLRFTHTDGKTSAIAGSWSGSYSMLDIGGPSGSAGNAHILVTSEGSGGKVRLGGDSVEVSGALNVAKNLNASGQVDFDDLADGGSGNLDSGAKYVRAGAGGRLYASSTAPSSRAVKHDINPLELNDVALLQLQPVTFRYNEAPDTIRVGVIAEDAHDLGLGLLVGYGDRTNPAKPTGFDYDGLSVALLGLVQRHEKRLAALENGTAA
jgi:hypothetical protein